MRSATTRAWRLTEVLADDYELVAAVAAHGVGGPCRPLDLGRTWRRASVTGGGPGVVDPALNSSMPRKTAVPRDPSCRPGEGAVEGRSCTMTRVGQVRVSGSGGLVARRILHRLLAHHVVGRDHGLPPRDSVVEVGDGASNQRWSPLGGEHPDGGVLRSAAPPASSYGGRGRPGATAVTRSAPAAPFGVPAEEWRSPRLTQEIRCSSP